MSRRVDDLLDSLTMEEQVSLLAGRNAWETVSIEHAGIPRLRVSDGPAGVRGTRFDGPASMNVPCSTALAASWDTELVREVGELLGRELLAKGARVHLAPTVNLHRTPVGGRNFECMSEDPYLTAMTALQYVLGVQSNGVASCIKHFVGNDTEFERHTIDSQIDERTLRELYLVPFERAVIDGKVLSVMSSYNKINGSYAADSPLLQEVLRDEWGFDGAVISDWFGLLSTVEGINAGVDLEMPGPPRYRGAKLVEAVEAGLVSREVVRERARTLLDMMERIGALDSPPGPETTRDDADDLAILRRASSAGMVLLQNRRIDGTSALPLAVDSLKSVAVIGPNAATGMVMGGGSAHVTPIRVSHPLDAIESRLGSLLRVEHAPGCNINKKLPELDSRLVSDVVLEFFEDPDLLDDPAAVPAQTGTTGTFRIMWFADPLGRRGGTFSHGARMSMRFTPDVTGDWSFGVESVAAARVMVDGALVLDNTDDPPGGSFFGSGKHEKSVTIPVVAGRTYDMVIELRHRPIGTGLSGVNIGAMPPPNPNMMGEAIDAAARCDASIVIVGTNNDWESEGWDRTDIVLPGSQDELVSQVARVSKKTIVVVNAGSPVAMPWIDEVDAVLYAWFPGQEMGDALVDLLLGEVEPSGRLPVTLPRRLEDTPAFEHHPGRNGEAKYLEGRLIGYRWYDTVGREPLFPFGFGLGYADVQVTSARAVDPHHLSVGLTNGSDRDGVQVVQAYAHLVSRAGLPHDEPDQKLVGYARVRVPAGGSVEASVALDRDAYRAWDLDASSWSHWSGDVELRVGTSSRHVAHRVTITL